MRTWCTDAPVIITGRLYRDSTWPMNLASTCGRQGTLPRGEGHSSIDASRLGIGAGGGESSLFELLHVARAVEVNSLCASHPGVGSLRCIAC